MGLNATARLKAAGIDIRKSDAPTLPLSAITIPQAPHPLAHPRFGDALDPEMVADIKQRGIIEPFLIREDGTEMLCLDGSRRHAHGLEAQRELRAEGKLKPDEELRVKVVFFTGTLGECILARLSANTDPLKKPDAPSVLAATLVQLAGFGVDLKAIARVCPKGVGPKEIDALLRWGNLVPELRGRFDSGELPVGLLSAVLAEPADKQVAHADALVNAGATSSKGATRIANRLKREEAIAGGAPAPTRETAHAGLQRIHPKTLAKVIESVDAWTGTSEDVKETIATCRTSEKPKERAEAAEEMRNIGFAEGLKIGLRFALGEDCLSEVPENIRKDVRKTLNEIKKTKAAKLAKKAAKS